MPDHFYLPQLTNANIASSGVHGHWFNNEQKVIVGISDAIAVGDNSLTKGISSIPDIWARPLLFQSAIKTNSNHPLRNICIQEWRGLMSILALHRINSVFNDIIIEPVQLDGGIFPTALINLAPVNVCLEPGKPYKWTDIVTISYQGIALGALSPTTLVYTGSDYRRLLPPEFPLKDSEGYLRPPLNETEGLRNVGLWLTNFKNSIQPYLNTDAEADRDRKVVMLISELISDWLKDIHKILQLEPNEVIDVKKYKVATEMQQSYQKPMGFVNSQNGYNIYRLLLCPLVKSGEQEGANSDLLLQYQHNHGPAQHVVIVNEKLLENDVNIWGETHSKPLGKDAAEIISKHFARPYGNKFYVVNLESEGGMWIRPELYFLSDTLLRSQNENILNEEESLLNISSKYILPFTRHILEYFEPRTIKYELQPTFTEENEGLVKFSFKLPLQNNKSITIEKRYKVNPLNSGPGEIRIIEPPALEVFPKYMGQNWRKYYMFNSEGNTYTFKPITFSRNVSIISTSRDAIIWQNTLNNEYSSVYSSMQDTSACKKVMKNVVVTEISGDHCFPEGIEVLDKGQSLGLILLSKEKANPGLAGTWKIGIDFGTSNTNIFSIRGEGMAERWKFNFHQYGRNILRSNAQLREILMEEYFFPCREVQLPVPSTMKIFNKGIHDTMVLDYFIYFPSHYKLPQEVLSDIKWNTQSERQTEYFLESLFYLILIEVVNENVSEIEIACSFPKAFNELTIQIFKGEWEAVYSKLLLKDQASKQKPTLVVHTGATIDSLKKTIINQPQFHTEGIATGEYFGSDKTIDKIQDRAKKENAAVCIDVGGGTSDISIWLEDNIIFDASLLLAGRQLSVLIQKYNKITELLFSDKASIALDECRNDPAQFSARLNIVLKKEEQEIANRLIRFANDKNIKWLRQIIALEFGALAYYTGRICYARSEFLPDLRELISDSIRIHWGGNAAKLINWIDLGKYDTNGIASKILNAMFFNGLADPVNPIKPKAVGQLQSPGHKSEASGGLVVILHEKKKRHITSATPGYPVPDTDDLTFPEFDTEESNGIIYGETVELRDGSKLTYGNVINQSELFTDGRTTFKSTSLEELKKFVDIFNYFGVKYGLFTQDNKIKLTDDWQRTIRDHVRAAFVEMAPMDTENRIIEPVFIMEVKILLELLKQEIK